MERTNFCAYIALMGNDDFPLDVVTERMSVQPTEAKKIGERSVPNHPTNHHVIPYTRWIYEVVTEEPFDTEHVLRPLLDVCKSKTDTINLLKKELN
ncbi:DUF4279 domain-containing protein [Lysinibacillus sp. 54212]|uniref:DUF4279 domain-containing protein n=1 Tax=Lysinibacillus sp. 54212 TaxID=3119829 RepID=UPI002FC704C1